MREENIIEAVVKWFYPKKGYGFLSQGEGYPDIFIHFSSLERAGLRTLHEGDLVTCEVVDSRDGIQVDKIIELKKTSYLINNKEEIPQRETFLILGEIKWYNEIKGFGFIYPNDNDREIFFHGSVVNSHDIIKLKPGTLVQVEYFMTNKGREALKIRFVLCDVMDL